MTGHRQQFTRTSTRLKVDFGRVGEALAKPGMDPRAWCVMARVDEETEADQDVLVWDRDLGWLVDVTVVGGPMDGEGPINCRLASFAQGDGVIEAKPPRSGALVCVIFPNGDPNDDAIIVGELTDDDNPAPMSINGDNIVERNASEGEVSALETHITVAPFEDLDQEWRNVRITGNRINLGVPEPEQSFARGNDLADALDNLADALRTYAQTLSTSGSTLTGGVPLTAAVDAAAQLSVDLELFKAARDQYLSTRIKGD